MKKRKRNRKQTLCQTKKGWKNTVWGTYLTGWKNHHYRVGQAKLAESLTEFGNYSRGTGLKTGNAINLEMKILQKEHRNIPHEPCQ